MAFDRDLVISGGGPVGAALALALRDADFRVSLFEARGLGAPVADDRVLALSHGGRLILERLGVWCRLARAADAPTPIREVRVSQRDGRAETIFRSAELGLPALGYVVAYRDLVAAFDAELAARGLAVLWQTPLTAARGAEAFAWFEAGGVEGTAALIALADGAGSSSCWEHDYGQCALLASVRLADAGGCALERFTAQGPIALLPWGERHALIWTLPAAQGEEVLRLGDAAFLARLAEQFGAGGDAISDPRARRCFPLRLRVARDTASRRLVRVGNAAQALHPVAAQGLNLGLRDAYELAQVLLDGDRSSLGSERQLQCYKNRRRRDRWSTTLMTHGLVELFGWQSTGTARIRDWGLEMLGASAGLRGMTSRWLMHGLR